MNTEQLNAHIAHAISCFGTYGNKPFRVGGNNVLVKIAQAKLTGSGIPYFWNFSVHNQLDRVDYALFVARHNNETVTMFLIPAHLIDHAMNVGVPNNPTNKWWKFKVSIQQAVEQLSKPKGYR